jgi:hypothetical protein
MPDDTKKKKNGGRPNLDADLLANALTATKHGPDLVMFAGLLGDDEDKEQRRLYVDYELNTFICIPNKYIVHRENVRNQAGLEVSLVWVPKNISLEIRETSKEQVQADFLSKALAAAESGKFPPAQLGVGIPAITPITPITPFLTKIFCTNITCLCTSRHSLSCSLLCRLPETQLWCFPPEPAGTLLWCFPPE